MVRVHHGSPNIFLARWSRGLRHLPFTQVTRVRIPYGSPTQGRLAQLGEHLPYKQGVGGSIPSSPTIKNKIGSCGVAVNMPACHAGDRGFDSRQLRHFYYSASIAQSVEQRTENPRVAGSIPARGTILFLTKI